MHKQLSSVRRKKGRVGKQGFRDNLSISTLNLFAKVNTLPSLETISLVKVEIKVFKILTQSHAAYLIKG